MVRAYVCMKISEYPPPLSHAGASMLGIREQYQRTSYFVFGVTTQIAKIRWTHVGIVGGNVGVAAYQPCTNIEPTQQCRLFSYYLTPLYYYKILCACILNNVFGVKRSLCFRST